MYVFAPLCKLFRILTSAQARGAWEIKVKQSKMSKLVHDAISYLSCWQAHHQFKAESQKRVMNFGPFLADMYYSVSTHLFDEKSNDSLKVKSTRFE